MRKPIFYQFDDGMMLYAVLKAGAAIRVTIEHLDGRPYPRPGRCRPATSCCSPLSSSRGPGAITID